MLVDDYVFIRKQTRRFRVTKKYNETKNERGSWRHYIIQTNDCIWAPNLPKITIIIKGLN